ncbi:MAG: hypothetical protein EWM73_03744 [Nitrospira sp.]|nr:MAG: hypothetical protein EWM73_03744 [Nitrospira sp.]
MSRNVTVWRLSFAVILLGLFWPMAPESSAGTLDQLTDLTGKATVVVTLTGRDNFTSEYRYNVSVRNHTSDLLIADSLVIVLDKITNLAGEDREGLTGESFLTRFDILGQDGETDDGKPFFRIPVGPTQQDGETDDGKPFFRIPVGPTQDLASLTDSLPATVRLRNKDYLSVFTPSFKVLGQKRPPPEPKQTPAAQVQPGATPTAPSHNSVDKLIQLLIKKGVVTEEEWRKANQP